MSDTRMQSHETQLYWAITRSIKMSLLPLPEWQADLQDDWRTIRQSEPVSILVLGDVRSKIRSSIKIAQWNLAALCHWSAVNISHIKLSLSLSVFVSVFTLCLSAFLCPSLLSKPLLYLCSQDSSLLLTLICACSSSQRPVAFSALPKLCVMLILVSSVIWCCLFRARGHTCISRQGWLLLSCP